MEDILKGNDPIKSTAALDLKEIGRQSIEVPANIIEGESLVRGAKATEGQVTAQEMGDFAGQWSGLAQLWWRPAKPGARLTLTLNAPESKEYELAGYFTRAPDYGDVRPTVNGQPLATVGGYSPDVAPSGPVSFGRVPMKAGANEIILEVVGKNEQSTGYLVGIDGFVLKP
jgi:hypothetical protein